MNKVEEICLLCEAEMLVVGKGTRECPSRYICRNGCHLPLEQRAGFIRDLNVIETAKVKADGTM